MPIVKAHIEGIERAARALWDVSYGASTMEAWEQLREELKEHWRERARAVVNAYQSERYVKQLERVCHRCNGVTTYSMGDPFPKTCAHCLREFKEAEERT